MLLGFTARANAATIGWNHDAAGMYDYNDPANWVAGAINGIWDSSLSLAAGQTITFAADTVLSTGLTFGYDGGFNETLRGTGGDRTLTLGGDILVNTISTTRTITLGAGAGQNLNVDLGGVTRTFTVGTGRTLGFVNVISNGGIIASGGTINFSGANTYSGSTTINAGTAGLNGASGSAANSDFTLNANRTNNTTLVFNSNTSGVTGTTRAKSVTLNGPGNSNGVFLNTTGNSGADSTDTITNALSAVSGFSTVTVTPNAARNARLETGSFSRAAGSTVLFRGTDLGVSPIASLTAGDANIQIAGPVTLVGGAGAAGQSTIGIIKGAYGDITANGAGSGLVTFDAARGVRLLDTATEYIATIANGQSQLDNVRFVRASGEPSQEINLSAVTTAINSLSFRITGAGTDSGVTISGDPGATLKLNSGVIFASQAVTTAAASDAMTISVPTLDLNGQEGVFIAFTAGVNNGNTAAPLQINSSIANDGGQGVTIGGTGEVIFGGSAAHTYTGTTTINSGILRLNKSVTNIGIPGDLLMNGGTLLKNSNAIPDTADLTLNGGTFWFDSATSSGNNGHTETLNDLTMNGGIIGHHGSNAVFNITGNAAVNAGDLTMNPGGDLTVSGATMLNGGRLIVRESSSTTAVNALTTLNSLAISNQAGGAYTAVVVNSHATNRGGRLDLMGDVTFTGNATNTQTVEIGVSDSSLANQGTISLNGTRVFNVGNGAAVIDLSVVPAMADDGANVGGLTKAGSGTLALMGDNTYSGPTTISSGALVVGGSLSGTSTIDVAAAATLASDEAAAIATAPGGNLTVAGNFAPGGLDGFGILTLDPGSGGKLTFASGSTLQLELQSTPASSDRISFATAGDWLGGSGQATLSLGGMINYNTAYTILENATTPGFTFAAIVGYDTLNYSASVSLAGDDYQLSFVAIPEPGIAGLLACGLGVFAGAPRSRGRKPVRVASSAL